MDTLSRLLLFILICTILPKELIGQGNFPYQLKKSDIALLSIGLSSKLIADYRENGQDPFPFDELANLQPDQVNAFDRSATKYWNKNLDAISNWGSIAIIASPSLILLDKAKNRQWNQSITYGTMYLEVALLTKGITDLTKTLVLRKRPFLYNPNLSFTEKEELAQENVYDSFFSGHTAAAFATAVFLSKTYADIYGNKRVGTLIWASSLSLASTMGYLRYRSGEHFPSDIIVGAAVGSCIGYLIPVLHKNSSETQSLSMMLSGNYLKVCYKF